MTITKLTTRRPSVLHDKSAMEIIGVNNFDLLKEHFRLSLKAYSPERFESIMSQFSEDQRTMFGEIYERLREHGMYPRSIDNRGDIVFGIALEGNVEAMMEKKYPLKSEYSKEEILTIKTLGRAEQPISKWPVHIFDKPVPF
jgi:hypothetical protein